MRTARAALPLVAMLTLTGCGVRAARSNGDDPAGRVITAAQIARTNADDAYEVLERIGGYTLSEGDGGVSIRQRRGRSSVTNAAADRPMVLLDNVLLTSAGMLREVRAPDIDRIVILSPGEATARYGTGAAAGAILIYTRGH